MAEDVKYCVGYGRHEGVCEQPIDHEALGLNPSGLWCVNCELNRREAIDKQMKAITESFGREESSDA